MTKEKAEALVRLYYFTECLKCQVSGKPCDFCCPTQYMAGNMEEIIKSLEVILKDEGFILKGEGFVFKDEGVKDE